LLLDRDAAVEIGGETESYLNIALAMEDPMSLENAVDPLLDDSLLQSVGLLVILLDLNEHFLRNYVLEGRLVVFSDEQRVNESSYQPLLLGLPLSLAEVMHLHEYIEVGLPLLDLFQRQFYIAVDEGKPLILSEADQ
jgi:hypothetical protein